MYSNTKLTSCIQQSNMSYVLNNISKSNMSYHVLHNISESNMSYVLQNISKITYKICILIQHLLHVYSKTIWHMTFTSSFARLGVLGALSFRSKVRFVVGVLHTLSELLPIPNSKRFLCDIFRMHKHNYTLHNYTLSNNFVWPFRVAIKLRMKYKMWKKTFPLAVTKKTTTYEWYLNTIAYINR